MPPAGQQETAKQATSNERNQMAIRPYWATTDREANNTQCADQNGDMPQPGNKRPQSKQHPMRRPKWRYAPAESQQFAKRVMYNAQNKMAICHSRATTDRKANTIQCAE